MAAQPSRVVTMCSPQRVERRFDVLVTIGQHAADDQHAGRRHDPLQIVGKVDQGRREDVGDDDVELSVDVRQRRGRDVHAIGDAVRRGVGSGDRHRRRGDVDRGRPRCTEHARADGQHA